MDVVIGAGMGGLTSAIALARAGRRVTLFEASDRVGGLAGGVPLGDRTYDGGPYILLDRPGLEWVFDALGIPMDLEFIRLDEPYRVHREHGLTVSLYDDLDRTADTIDRNFPGAGDRYRDYIARITGVYERLMPLQRQRPTPLALMRHGAVLEAPFLLRGLQHHLVKAGLPDPVVDLLGIWTHIAGQPLDEAPAPLAFVPAIIHRFGAWTIRGGIHLIPQRLAKVAEELGVDIRLNEPVAAIVRDGRRVLGVDLADGTRVNADHVISNAPGISTYTSLLRPPDPQLCADLLSLPLQSPGVSAYLKVQATDAPFLQFLLPRSGKCRLFLCPGAVDDTRQGHARLVSPVDHGWAERVGQAGLSTHLDQLLDESWWKTQVSGFEILSRRLPGDWGRRHHLHRDSMNPVMTARFMRKGRIPHQSPVADNLYLAGSATHPGQWVSFCSISGILAARLATS